MLTLQEFKNSINFIKEQNKKQDHFCNALERLSPGEYVNCFLYSEYEVEYIKMLKKAMNISPKDDTLEWWMYDCEYGKKHPEIGITLKDHNKEFYLDTVEKLYKFLLEECQND